MTVLVALTVALTVVVTVAVMVLAVVAVVMPASWLQHLPLAPLKSPKPAPDPSEKPLWQRRAAPPLESSRLMKSTPLAIPDVVLLEPTVFGDDRGFFFESFNQAQFDSAIGRCVHFVQDNHSRSAKNVLRGLHYQVVQPQGKLVHVVAGAIFDVAVDLRQSSPTFGQWVGEVLSADNKKQMWIPEGFAHGFAVLTEFADFLYKTTDYWIPAHERAILWNDPQLNIDWQLQAPPVLSSKDQNATPFAAADYFSCD